MKKQTCARHQTIRGIDRPAPAFNARLKEAFISFMEIHPAATLSKNLRNMLVEYIMQPSATESVYLYETLAGFEALFTLLDAIEDEAYEAVQQQKSKTPLT
jgi:hypothetical protein